MPHPGTKSRKHGNSKRKADRRGKTEAKRFRKAVVLLNNQERRAKHRTVGGDEGQIDAERAVQRRNEATQKHFNKLYKCGDDQDKRHRLKIFQMKGRQQKVIHCPCNGTGDCHDKGHRHTHTQCSIRMLRHTEKRTAAVKFGENEVFNQHGRKHQQQNIGKIHTLVSSSFAV